MSQWLRFFDRGTEAPVRLFCLPYAGGGASVFRGWSPALAGTAEVVAVQYPGRENRIAEPPLADMTELVRQLVAAIDPFLDRRFVLFGYSMGARVAHALAATLVATGRPTPERVLVAASPGPAAPPPPPVHALPEAELLAHLRRLGGTPPEFFDSDELRRLALPPLRADLAVVESATHPPRPALRCPLHAFAGERDTEASPERMSTWAAETVGPFGLESFDAGHFFLHSHRDELLRLVRGVLTAASR